MDVLSRKLRIGAVVIGRNEGQRLVRCLESLLNSVDYVVYVDSGSSDKSVQEAERRGVECLSLDMNLPFTAARARNEGANYLLHKFPDLNAIQFIDGDCEVQPDWISKAQDFLEAKTEYAVVCGRRRERFPEQSIYNQLCDIEWNTPVGDAMACGGDALIRVSAFIQADGYKNCLIAGEEPEMCFRLRAQGWKIYRLDEEMTLHDAAITKVCQWWSRAKRAGYAYATLCYLHGYFEERFKVKEVFSIIIWACLIPVMVILLSLIDIRFIVLLILYLLQIIRVSTNYVGMQGNIKISPVYALSVVIAKFPQFLGIVKFVFDKVRGFDGKLIEYK